MSVRLPTSGMLCVNSCPFCCMYLFMYYDIRTWDTSCRSIAKEQYICYLLLHQSRIQQQNKIDCNTLCSGESESCCRVAKFPRWLSHVACGWWQATKSSGWIGCTWWKMLKLSQLEKRIWRCSLSTVNVVGITSFCTICWNCAKLTRFCGVLHHIAV